MGGTPNGIDIDPQTITATGNSTLNSHSVKDGTNVQTEINIRSDTLFLVLLFLLFVAILIVYSYNRFHLRAHQDMITELQSHPALQHHQIQRRRSDSEAQVDETQV